VSALDDCKDQNACCSEAMRYMPQVGSNEGIDRWYGRAGCGFMVVPDGTYGEANAGVVQHRNEVRAANGLGPLNADMTEADKQE
jgi:hypothetical protein